MLSMLKTVKPKSYWMGLVVYIYSFFLLLQGLWVLANYQYIYPEIYWVPSGYVPNYDWVFQMTGAIVPSIAGGLILMITGLYIMSKR